MNYASIAFHFDSLGEAYDYPAGYVDPSFTVLAERMFEAASPFDFKYTIFVIGRDLEFEANRRAVQQWFRSGHEIASHSYCHRYDYGAFSQSAIKQDIERAQNLIEQTTGRKPLGFTAPAWSSSPRVTAALEELGYLYDASLMPSWLRYAALGKTALNFLATKRFFYAVNQRDPVYPLLGRRQWHTTERGLVRIPVPTDRYRWATWHTVAFVFGWKRHEAILRRALDEVEAFHYVVHPADVLSDELLLKESNLRLARVSVPLDIKKRYLHDSFDIIARSGRKIVTMQEMTDRLTGMALPRTAAKHGTGPT